MTGLRIATACCAAALAALAAASPTPAAANAPPMVERINSARANHGLAPLRHSPYLRRSSRRWGTHLMRTKRFGHMGIRASRRFRYVGEVLAYHGGWKPRRGRAVRRWLRSPGHRAALLSGSFRHVGTALVRGRIGGRRITFWVVQFGQR
jgi:uncharacterized protein YkwD